jgi:hypothetical protein
MPNEADSVPTALATATVPDLLTQVDGKTIMAATSGAGANEFAALAFEPQSISTDHGVERAGGEG